MKYSDQNSKTQNFYQFINSKILRRSNKRQTEYNIEREILLLNRLLEDDKHECEQTQSHQLWVQGSSHLQNVRKYYFENDPKHQQNELNNNDEIANHSNISISENLIQKTIFQYTKKEFQQNTYNKKRQFDIYPSQQSKKYTPGILKQASSSLQLIKQNKLQKKQSQSARSVKFCLQKQVL